MTWKKKMKSLLLQASQVPLPVCILTTEILWYCLKVYFSLTYVTNSAEWSFYLWYRLHATFSSLHLCRYYQYMFHSVFRPSSGICSHALCLASNVNLYIWMQNAYLLLHLYLWCLQF
jgi:hypothetical protein